MPRSRFWKRSKNYQPKRLLQQLEERIVLDAAVNPTQDNPNDQPGSQTDAGQAASQAGAAAAPAGDAAGGNAGLVAQLPTNFEHVFGQDLNVVLVANNLADVDVVSQAAADNAHVITYDAGQDNLATITSLLQDIVNSTGQKIDNLAIVGHGTSGNLLVGADQIQYVSLTAYGAAFEALGQTLSPDAQIQFFGCSIAGDAMGQAMIDTIAVYTAADTFASTDTTGGHAHDWTLEYASNSSVAMQSLLNVDALAADNTPLAAPTLVKTIDTSSSSSVTSFVEVNGKAYFIGSDGVHVNTVFEYDPTTGNTTLLDSTIMYASNLTSFNNSLYFRATDGAHGYELWTSNAGGTHIVKDINPVGDGLGATTYLAGFNGMLYFTAGDSSTNTELWKTDGTDAGTTLVKEINPSLTTGSNPGSFMVNGTTLYFGASDGTNGFELWKTDGTSAGTTMVKDIYAGANGGSPSNMTVFGTNLYFTATTSANGAELWTSDGTTAGTVMVKDINAGTASSSAGNFTIFNGKLYFTATDGTTAGVGHGVELWSTDGTTAGTTMVKDINTTTAPVGSSSPTNLTVFNGKLYFSATDGNTVGSTLHGRELWSTDGTAAGTTMVRDIYAGVFDSGPANLTVFNGKLYFTAQEPTGLARGIELWATDGTTTDVVMDINAGTGSSSPSGLTVSGGKLYFAASDGTAHGGELWYTDGATTAMVEDINVGAGSGGPSALKDIGGKLVFTANDGLTGSEPWVSDGTAAGTHLIKDINLGGAAPQWLTNLNGTLYFAQSDPVHGLELWKSDGTAAGTTLVMDLYPGTTGGMYSQSGYVPTVVNGTLYFLGMASGTTDSALYKLDNAGNPVLVTNLVAGYADRITSFTGVENTLYFINGDASNGLWRSDGTAAGTAAVTTASGVAITNAANLTNVNGTLFFQAGNNTPTGAELYKVDSVTGKAVMVQDLAPGSYTNSSPSNLTDVGGTLYFTATVGTTVGLYSSDGTTITPVTNTLGVTAFANLTAVNGTLFFTGTAAATGAELYMVDNATGSIVLAADIIGGTTGSSPTNLYNANGTLFFSATDSTNGKEVWTYTSGAGASLLKDINPGTGSSFFTTNTFTYLDGLTYFKATNGTNGDELWQTDGTPGGTVMAGDINAGINGSNPAYLTAVNNSVFFAASGGTLGNGLWKVDGAGTNTIPTATLMDQANTIDEDSGAFSLQDIVVTDTDASDLITATLDLNNAAAGVLSANNGATYDAATGFWSVSGSVTEVNTALANVTFTPTADWNGTVNITSHVQDAHVTGPANGLITVNVTAMNDAPILAPLTVNLNEDPAAPVAIVLSGNPGPADEQGQTLTYVLGDLTGINGKLYADPAGTIQLASGAALLATAAGPSPVTVYYVPDANYNGAPTFTFTATDNGPLPVQGVNAPATVTLNVAAINDAPVNAVPVSVTVNEDILTPITGVSISDVDAGTSVVQVTLNVTNGTLLVNNAVTGGLAAADITGNGTGSVVLNGTLAAINATLADLTGLQYQSVLNYNGPDTLTVSTNDLGAAGSPGPLTDIDPIGITVSPVNDAPVNTVNSINVPAGSGNIVSLTGGLSVHDPDLGDTLFVDVRAGTGVTGLGYGSGTHFVPEYVFMGTESYLNAFLGGLKAQVAAGFSGNATVLVTTTDLTGLSATDTITISLAGPTQAPPQITTGAVAYTVYEDPAAPVNLGNCVSVSDPNGDPLTVDLAASAGWSGLNATASGAAVVTGGGTSALHIAGSMVDVQNTLLSLQGTLIANFNGTATFGVTASDGINAPVIGSPVNVPVIAVNDAPVNTLPLPVTVNEDVLTPVTGISISDVDSGTGVVQVTLSVANGTLQVSGGVASGLTGADITGNGTGSVVLNGTLAAINATLADATGLQYQSLLNYNGADTLTVSTNDLGATGTPGPLTTTNLVGFTVNAVDDAPVNTVPGPATATTDLLTPVTGISISDVDAGTSVVQVTLSVAHGTLQVNGGVTGGLTAADITGNGTGSVVLSGTMAAINATLANATGLQYLSGLHYTGADTLVVSTNDLGATGSGGPLTTTDLVAITVNATAANHAPVINLSSAVQQTDPTGAVMFNAAHGDLITVSDVDAGTGLVKVTLTATHGTMTLNGVTGLTFDPGQGDGTADVTMTFAGTLTDVNNALNGMSYNRAAGYTGLADVTVTVNDQGNTGTGGPLTATSVANLSVEPYNVWFHGFGTEAGWDVFNYTTGACSYYTQDYSLYWQHMDVGGAWNFWNGTAYVHTDALGHAPYDGGYGPPNQWFHETTGTYSGYDVFISAPGGTTYYSPNYAAAGATFWQHTSAGAWSYWDGSAWYSTTGFNVEPVNVWFHGYGADLGYDVFNHSSTGDMYYTQNHSTYWWFVASTSSWSYWNGTAWVPTTDLGVIV